MGRRTLAGAAAALLAWLACGSCSLLLPFDPDDMLERTFERCSDGVDNDDNGLTDCAEPDCAVFDFCRETSEAACQDRLDNDRNGLIDCEDPGCVDYPMCTENKDGQCADGNDNNDNSLVDCQDFTCQNAPACCTLQELMFAAPLGPEGGCPDVETCEVGQTGSACNAFDPGVWLSVGDPAPAVAADGAGFDPNRCDACYGLGTCGCDAVLLTRDSFPFRPGLMVGAQLHVDAGQGMRAGLTLTWQTSYDESPSCPSGAPPVDRVAAAELTRDASGARALTLVVDGVAERTLPWDADDAAAFVKVDAEGFALFYVTGDLGSPPSADASPVHRSNRPLPEAAASVHLALYGGGAGERVSAAGVWDAARCHDPTPSRLDVYPHGTVLGIGAPDWERGMVSDPTVVEWNGALHMYYVGRNAPEGLGVIGHAVLAPDATAWERDSDAEPVIAPGFFAGEADDETEFFGPAAAVLSDGRLRLYFTMAHRDGEAILWTGIAGAVSDDGELFAPLQTLEGDRVLLAPVEPQGDVESWQAAVRDPSVAWRQGADGPELIMLYAGRSDPENPFTAQIGLATSPDGVTWNRHSSPVVTPPQDALIHTAVSDPTVVWDEPHELYRLWYVWRVAQQFSIYHAVATGSAEDWISYPGNPVLRSGDAAWCDDQYLDGPSALLAPSGRLRFWYHGRSLTYGHSICYAENSIVK